MNTPVNAIEITDMVFGYNGQPILVDVNVSIPEKDFVTIIGPNGSGKSTLIKLFLGQLKPTRGRIRVFGKPPGADLSSIGYMAQNMDHDLQFPVNVMDVVLMGRLHHRHLFGRYDSEDKAVALNSLEEVGMEDLSKRPFSDLSGGQRQRVLIARSLATEPKLLLLDEPTSNVDIAVEKDFYELLQKLNERMTILVVAHDIGFVHKYVKDVVCVNKEVHMHPSASLSDRQITEIYGMEMQLVQHDHGNEEEHNHD